MQGHVNDTVGFAFTTLDREPENETPAPSVIQGTLHRDWQ